MPARRALLAVAVLLLMAALVSSVAPGPREPSRSAPTKTEPARAAVKRRTVEARLPADRVVRARVGDIVKLQVTSDKPDEARIADLGLAGPTEPGLPAELVFVADHRGRFAVELRDADRRVGNLEISSRR